MSLPPGFAGTSSSDGNVTGCATGGAGSAWRWRSSLGLAGAARRPGAARAAGAAAAALHEAVDQGAGEGTGMSCIRVVSSSSPTRSWNDGADHRRR